MTRAVIVGHKSILKETIDSLHDTSLFHIEDFVEDESGFKISKPFKNAEEVSKKLVKIRSIANYLGIVNKEPVVQKTDSVLRDLDSKLDELDSAIEAKIESIAQLENELKDLESQKKEIMPYLSINLDFDDYRGYESLKVFAGTIKGNLDGSQISSITKAYELYFDPQSKAIVLFVAKSGADKVYELLQGLGFRELRVPERGGVPSELLRFIEQREAEVTKKIESLKADIESLKSKYADFILASDEVLSIESQKAELPLRIATSANAFIIEGWTPTESYDKVVSAVNSATNGKAYVTSLEVEEEEEEHVPVEYNNSKIAEPMQQIMDLYSRPKYTELDPSSVILITFPLMYGLILGDIGYALILGAIALAIKKAVKSDAVKPLMDILIYCQISTFIFGIIYGEFLGFPLASMHSEHGVVPGLIPGWDTIVLFGGLGGEEFTFPIHRTHMVMTMIAVTVLIGLLHLNLGFLLGFSNIARHHGMKHAVLEKGSWIVIELGVLLAAIGYLGGTGLAYVGAVILVLGIVMLTMGEGIKGPIELPSLMGNALSYARIIAVGLSSIYIASTVNDIAFEMIWADHSKIGFVAIAAILVFILGHALNTVLSIIAPGLHALRLQYVEFFGKFYEGGGRKYNPFGYIRKYTEE
ncbi:V-type ATP synthase subunit I [Methanosarcina siciliae C2J]|uniref:A-type ATP synthase subunit I n=4 Tax=Methanosarcina siciliae TaxID=38027 RepID=A0A0E3PH83_9EURY|nr:V-type ATP synthase subunit I [Methanosarcina siciliae T4/M]AKB34139.1 V-type ATP synthase subunit I [Methanosarcina siciliae HI350]AKB38510.1 V-type ATP synthase subunit I [Methanosarcina siciliae C2J]